MSKINNTAFIQWTDTSDLENEINNIFSNNPDIDINNIMIFAEISQYSYYPIQFTIDDNNHVKIDNSIKDYIGLNLYVGSKRQFLHKKLTISNDTYKIELDPYFKTAWNKDKFIIFQNGYLMNKGVFTFIIPSFDNDYSKKYIYSTAMFKKNNRIDIYYIESDDNFMPLPISRDLYLGAIKYLSKKNNEKVIPIPYPYKNKTSSFFVFTEQGEYLNKDTDYTLSYDNDYIILSNPLELATVDYIIFAFPHISKEEEIIETNQDTNIIDNTSSGYYFNIQESTSGSNGYINYSPGFNEYTLTKSDFLLFGNSTFIHPSRYNISNNKSLRMISTEDRNHASWAKYSMIIPFNKIAKDKYKEDYAHPQFQIVEIVISKRTNEIEMPILDKSYESFLVFRNSLILPIYDEDRFVMDDINHKFMIVNEEDWIPENTTVTFIFMKSTTNTDSKLLLVQESFKCTDYETQLPSSIYRYPDQKFTKSNMLLFLNGTFVVPDRYQLNNNTISLVDEDIDLRNNHVFTVVYLDEVYSTEYDIETNLIDRTYEDGLDDIIFETAVVTPL